ncbi:MAG: hypothetical protein ABH821_04815 [archaeon]
MKSQNRKLILGLILVVGFLYTVFTVVTLLGVGVHDETCSLQESCPHEEQLNTMYAVLPLFASIALLVGAGTYYLMAEKIENKDKSLKTTSQIILKFLNADEKRVVNKLIENKGKILQAEITRLEGMTKLKAHRTIQRLIDKQVIRKEGLGKTNIIKFSEEIENALLS